MSGTFEITVYPLRCGERLGANWVPLHFRRVRDSRWRAVVDAEARAYGFDLWCAACDQDPAGTLPLEDPELAMLAGLGRDVATWERVRDGALYGWREVICLDGEDDVRRLAHPIVAEVVVEAFNRIAQRQETAAAGAERKRFSKVSAKMREAGAASGLAEDHAMQVQVLAWLDQRRLWITATNVARAMEALTAGPGQVVPFRDGGGVR